MYNFGDKLLRINYLSTIIMPCYLSVLSTAIYKRVVRNPGFDFRFDHSTIYRTTPVLPLFNKIVKYLKQKTNNETRSYYNRV